MRQQFAEGPVCDPQTHDFTPAPGQLLEVGHRFTDEETNSTKAYVDPELGFLPSACPGRLTLGHSSD